MPFRIKNTSGATVIEGGTQWAAGETKTLPFLNQDIVDALAKGSPELSRQTYDDTKVADGDYKTVAASQSDIPLGANGQVGDVLDTVIVTVATPSTAQVQIKDGNGAAITVFPNNPAGGVGTYPVKVGLKSQNGGWKISTGAGSTAIVSGNFS